MNFQPEPGTIRWRAHFSSAPAEVFYYLSTDLGRAAFWAERTEQDGELLTFHFLNYPHQLTGKVIESEPPRRYSVEYFASIVTFELADDGDGGTDLSLIAAEVDEQWRMQMAAGWVTVLMSLKAAVDFGVDLRNHDPRRTWDQGYVDD